MPLVLAMGWVGFANSRSLHPLSFVSPVPNLPCPVLVSIRAYFGIPIESSWTKNRSFLGVFNMIQSSIWCYYQYDAMLLIHIVMAWEWCTELDDRDVVWSRYNPDGNESIFSGCLPTSFSVCLVFFPLSLCLARWFWPDLMNRRHVHITAVCVSLRWSGGLRVVRLPATSWYRLPRW